MTPPDITPGEWSWQPQGNNKHPLPRHYKLNAFHGKGLAITVLEADEEVWPKSPDAKAIAAVPELLQALERARNTLKEHMNYLVGDPEEECAEVIQDLEDTLMKAGYTFP